jgi:bacteriorhodopsin
METLSTAQYDLVFNLLSLTLAAMLAAGIFFLGARQQVAPRYRIALLISAVVVFIAGYHYFRIWESWKAAYTFQDGAWVASGIPFNDAYRYADWLITVPLLLVELVAVLGLARMQSSRLIRNLTIASFLMIVLGYPGEVSAQAGVRWLWWALAMLPFGYIIYVLYTRLSAAVADQGGEIRNLLGRARTILVLSWWVYPVAFVLPMIGLSGAAAEVGLQVGYSIADLTAKAGFGIVIYQIARAKSEGEGFQKQLERAAA